MSVDMRACWFPAPSSSRLLLELGTRNREPSNLEPRTSNLEPAMSDLPSLIRARYGAAASRVSSGEGVPASCCESTGCCGGSAASSCDPITSNLYGDDQTSV